MSGVAVASPPTTPAYPRPVAVPAAPHGDPAAARELAAAHRILADAVDEAGHRCVLVLDRLEATWRGTGSTTTRTAASAIAHDAAIASRGLREIADQLDRYAHHLESARHHHGWSIGRLLAVGAAVAVTATAVVVTVGAVAPVGSAAAVEVADALAGAEAAASAASAAEIATAGALSECATTAFTGQTGLIEMLRPHLVQGLVAAAADVTGHLTSGQPIDAQELLESLLGGVALSAGAGAALAAVRGVDGFDELAQERRLLSESLAIAATDSAVDATRQYVHDRAVDVRSALTFGLAGGTLYAFGGASPVGAAATPVRPILRGQSLEDLLHRVRLADHEGRGGHTIARHVGKSAPWLAARIAVEGRAAASSFYGLGAAESAVRAVLRERADTIRRAIANGSKEIHLRHELPVAPGYVQYADGSRAPSRIVCLRLIRRGHLVHILTAYVEEQPDFPDARLCRDSDG